MYKDAKTDKPIYEITKFTMLDYPDNLASIFWFSKCNMRCSYCYNSDIVFGKGRISTQEAIEFLKSRTNKLTGVVLSGGECTNYPKLKEFASIIKNLGFKIKIDTNGTNPKCIKELIKKDLVDYIALDYKAPKYKFKSITKISDFDDFEETLLFLIKEDFPFEARTTVHSNLLNIEDLNHIIDDLHDKGYKNNYFLQNYLHVENTIGNTPQQQKEIAPNLLNQKIAIKLREF